MQKENQRRRILFILPSLRGGGTERIITVLLRHLDRSRFEPHLALLEKEGPYLSEVPADVPSHDLGVKRVRYALPSLVRLVRNLRPNSVFSALCELNLATAFVKPLFPRGVRLLLQEVTLLSAKLAEEDNDTALQRWLIRRLYSRADKIICKADYMMEDLAEHFRISPGKMVRIYNPLDIARIKERADGAANPFTGEGPHIVAAGRLVKVKGFDLLLESLALVRQSVPARLTILGEGPLEADLKSQAERLGLNDTVRFIGFQNNPYPYLKHADLVVLSSRYEGLPAVIAEALALGTPVVATDCPGGVREILAGCNMGWLVPESNPKLLADAIVSGCKFKAEKPSAPENSEGILDKFRIDRVMKQYENIL